MELEAYAKKLGCSAIGYGSSKRTYLQQQAASVQKRYSPYNGHGIKKE